MRSVRWTLRWNLDAVALALLAMVSFGISLKFAFDMPLLWGADERAHAGYTIDVMEGRLPTIHTPVLDDPARFPELSASLDGWKTVGRQIWVANHPPLYYLLTAPLMAVAEWLGVPAAGFLAMRVVNAAGTAASVVLVGLIARELVPGRRSVPLLAAAIAASASTLAMEGGYGYNDGLAAVAGSATLLYGIRLLRRGPRRGLLVAAALTGALAAGLKAPNLVAVAACTLMAGIAVLLYGPKRRWLAAAGTATLVGGVPALGFGWFYLRNLYLYGDLTAASALFTAFGRRSHYTVLETITSVDFQRHLFESFWIRPGYDPHLRPIPDALFAAAVIGLLLLLADWLRRRYAAPGTPSVPGPQAAADGPSAAGTPPSVTGQRCQPAGPVAAVPARRAAWCALLGHAVLLFLLLSQFRSGGGYLSQRYLLPVMPITATLLAVGVCRLAEVVPTRDRQRWQAMVSMLVSTGMLGLAFVAYRASMVSVERSAKVPGLEHSALEGPAPALALGVAALAALGFVILQARRVLELPDQDGGQPGSRTSGTDSDRAHHLVGGAPEDPIEGQGQLPDIRSAPTQVNSGSAENSTAIFTRCSAYLFA
ncbi:MAG: hypothetical protein ACRDTU_04785 [Micromonosporaceae bacterium]